MRALTSSVTSTDGFLGDQVTWRWGKLEKVWLSWRKQVTGGVSLEGMFCCQPLR